MRKSPYRGFSVRAMADEARFELAEGVALTRFRGVLLRPLGHSSRCCIKQLVYYAIASRRVKSAWRITGPRLSGEMRIDGSEEGTLRRICRAYHPALRLAVASASNSASSIMGYPSRNACSAWFAACTA